MDDNFGYIDDIQIVIRGQLANELGKCLTVQNMLCTILDSTLLQKIGFHLGRLSSTYKAVFYEYALHFLTVVVLSRPYAYEGFSRVRFLVETETLEIYWVYGILIKSISRLF